MDILTCIIDCGLNEYYTTYAFKVIGCNIVTVTTPYDIIISSYADESMRCKFYS